MALTATIFNFDIDLSDTDRNVYETLALRVAQHPSESDEYLIARLLAYTQWRTDYTISVIADAVVAGGLARRAGYTHVEDALELYNSPMTNYIRGKLVWMDTTQLLEDAAQFASGFVAQVDAEVELRRAKQA